MIAEIHEHIFLRGGRLFINADLQVTEVKIVLQAMIGKNVSKGREIIGGIKSSQGSGKGKSDRKDALFT